MTVRLLRSLASEAMRPQSQASKHSKQRTSPHDKVNRAPFWARTKRFQRSRHSSAGGSLRFKVFLEKRSLRRPRGHFGEIRSEKSCERQCLTFTKLDHR